MVNELESIQSLDYDEEQEDSLSESLPSPGKSQHSLDNIIEKNKQEKELKRRISNI